MDIKDKYRALFGAKLKELLDIRKMSNNDLAGLLGIERSNITQYKKGESCPKLDIFLSICEILKVKPEYFLDSSTKFEDYYNLKSKSESRKIIESIFTLCNQYIISKQSDEYYCSQEIWKYNSNKIYLIEQITEECYKFATSDLLDESINICEKIVNKYEKELSELFIEN